MGLQYDQLNRAILIDRYIKIIKQYECAYNM
jgi:hypothetical protein